MDETKSYRRIIFDQQTCFAKPVYKNGVRESMEFGQGVPAACQSAAEVSKLPQIYHRFTTDT